MEPPSVHSFKLKPYLIVGALAFTRLTVFNDQLISIGKYSYKSCADRVY